MKDPWAAHRSESCLCLSLPEQERNTVRNRFQKLQWFCSVEDGWMGPGGQESRAEAGKEVVGWMAV